MLCGGEGKNFSQACVCVCETLDIVINSKISSAKFIKKFMLEKGGRGWREELLKFMYCRSCEPPEFAAEENKKSYIDTTFWLQCFSFFRDE
jgi:hypothetical protein